MNAKLKKYVEIYRRNGSLDQVQLSPSDISNTYHEADMIFEAMDTDKVRTIT